MTSRWNQSVLGGLDGLLLAGIVAAMVLRLIVPGLATSFSSPSVNLFIDALPLLLITLYCLRFLLARERLLPGWGAGIAAILFLGWAALSAAMAGHRSIAVETWSGWAGVILLAYLFHLRSQDPKTRAALLAAFVCFGGVIAALGVEEALVEKEVTREMVGAHPDLVRISSDLRADFESRLRSDEISGPFLLSNLLAGYLVVAGLLTSGLLLDLAAARRTLLQRIRIGLLLAILILQVACLGLTGSKGAWVALIGGALAFVMALRPPRPGPARTSLILGAYVAGFLIITGWGLRLPGVVRLGGQSMEIRDEYFSATRGMIADHPVVGVGIGNFRDHYPAYRPPRAEETKFAHNNFLQAAAEMGLPGLLLLLYLCAAVVRGPGGERRQGIGSAGLGRVLLVFFGGAAGISTLAAFGPFSVRYTDWVSLAFILIVWGGFLLLYCGPDLRRGAASPAGRGLGAGAVAAAVAAGLHWTVDLDLYSGGVFFAVLGAVVLGGPPTKRGWKIPRGAWLGLTLVGLVGSAAICTLHLPAMMRHDYLRSRGEDLFWSAEEAEGKEREWRLEAAAGLYGAAAREKPWEGQTLLQRGRVLLALHRVRSDGEGKGLKELKAAIEHFEAASALAPASAERRYELARAYSALAAYDPSAVGPAEANLAAAVARYPTKPAYRYQYARFLFEVSHRGRGRSGALEAARREARAALEMDRLTRHDRLRLSEEAREACREILE